MVVMEIDTYLNKKSEYGEKIEKLNSSQRVLLIVQNLEREINNGGFHQFYWNSSGDYANETVDALNKIGAEKTAGIVNKANSEFPKGIVPSDRQKRWSKMKLISENSKTNWDKCNDEFYKYQDNLTELLIAFVIKNKADFKK